MKTTVSRDDFSTTFDRMGRGNNFTYEGRDSLFAYLEEMEIGTGTEYELDVIALCCDFTEYENLAEFQNDYGTEYETIDDIRDATTVIDVDLDTDEDGKEDGSFIIQAF